MCRQLGSRVTGQRHPLPPPAVCPPRGDVPNPEGRSNETPGPSTLPHAPFHPSGPQRGSVQHLMGQKRKKKAEKARDAALQAVPSLAVPVPCPAPALPPVDRERCQAGERLAAALQVLFSTRTFLLLPREQELCVSAGPGGAWQGAAEAGRRVGEVKIFFS